VRIAQKIQKPAHIHDFLFIACMDIITSTRKIGSLYTLKRKKEVGDIRK